MEDAARRPVGLPVANPTVSYWQDPPDPISDLRSTDALPSHADYVIIGSGITGASIAHFLLERDPAADILMLEARQASSGATGRNGGHTKAASYREWEHARAALGEPEANRIAQFEHANIAQQRALAAQLGIACDMRATPTVDLLYDEPQRRRAAATVAAMNARTPGPVERYAVLDAAAAAARFHCPGARGAVVYEAGSVSAYRLAVGLLRHALARGLNLQTRTPATALARADGGRGAWSVATPRGAVAARRVVLATNGYTAALEPSLQGLIVPLRGQMSAQRPGRGLPAELPGTYTFAYAGGYEYMVPRPAGARGAGDILIGGGWATLPDGGACEFGETDDGTLNADVAAYLRDCTARYFSPAGWGADDEAGRVRAEWTGVMGTSADGRPYVGPVPGRDGVWVCASFNGHGMALCVRSAAALVAMLVGDEDSIAGWFPESFRMGAHRLGKTFQGRRDAGSAPEEALEERAQGAR